MSSIIKYQYVLTIFLIFTQYLFAQNQTYISKHLDTHNGLAGEDVTGFAQDDKGFLWIATDNGLQRFDGENFVTYRHLDKDSTSLSYDEVFFPVLDTSNQLWLKIPDSYINILNLHNNEVTKIGANNDWGADSDRAFIFYCKDVQGNMWICSHRSLYRYNYYTKKPEKIASFPEGVICTFHGTMVRDSATGNLWIGLPDGLIEYDPDKNTFYYSSHNPDNIPVLKTKSAPYIIFIDRKHNLWISTWGNELFRYNIDSHDFKQFNVPKILTNGGTAGLNAMVRGIAGDKNNNIWIGTDKGTIFKYNNLLDTFNVSIPQLYERTFLNKTMVHSMYNDKEGNIWVATDFGAYFFNPEKQKIFSIENNSFMQFSFPARQVHGFTETTNKSIWVASRDGAGISVFDEQMNLVRRMFQIDDSTNKEVAGTWIWSLCEDHYKTLWMGAENELISYDLPSKKISILKIPQMTFVPYAMVNDDSGNLWIGGGMKIIKLNPLTKQFIEFSNLYAFPGNKNFEIRDMLIDKQKKFWVAADGGLFWFDPGKGQFAESFVHNKTGNQSLSDNEIVCMTVYNDSVLLLGTARGLNFFNTRTKKFSLLLCNDGSSSNVVQGINSDKDGNIFIATFTGLYKIDARTHNYTHYDSEDGILDNQFYTKIYKLRDGRMLAGGLNSFIYFNPADLRETFTPPDVQITGFKIFDAQYQPVSLIDSSNTVHLGYYQNFIAIQYASLYYNASAKIHYYYMLDGVDKNWVNAGSARSATYTDLDNGNYTFEVKCINDDGVASKNTTRLRINIATPWYKSWWFILLCIAASVTIIYAAYNYRLRSRRNLSIIRRRIASDLHDDIGSTLNSISVYSEVAGQQLQSNTEQAKTILEKMGSASRSMIDNMNDIVWSINPKNDDFENILQRMQYFAGELLSAKNILLQFDADENIKNIKLPMEKRKNFYLIYKEAINNAYKYAESKNVNVSIAEKDGSLIMIITDNGKGFDIVENGLGGNGLKNMKARAAELGAKFEIISWPGKGTRVFLKMKV